MYKRTKAFLFPEGHIGWWKNLWASRSRTGAITSSSFKLKIAFSQFFHNGFVPNCQKMFPTALLWQNWDKMKSGVVVKKCVFIAMLLYDMGAVSVFVVHSSDTLRYSHWWTENKAGFGSFPDLCGLLSCGRIHASKWETDDDIHRSAFANYICPMNTFALAFIGHLPHKKT